MHFTKHEKRTFADNMIQFQYNDILEYEAIRPKEQNVFYIAQMFGYCVWSLKWVMP